MLARLSGCNRAGPIRFFGHIKPKEMRRGAEFTRQGFTFGFKHIAKDHAGAFRNQQACFRRALAARTA
jgi:hypothetical protein